MRFLTVCLAMLVSACLAEETMTPCDVSLWDDLIGQPVSAADVVPDPKRILPPNSIVTKDYRLNRTNVDLDADGVIVRIWCG